MTPVARPSLTEVEEAASRIRKVILHTPLVPLHSEVSRGDILLKPEIHQAVTSFKLRGVFNAVALLPEEVRLRGVSTVSAGNTAQALAWAARYFGIPARSLMPDTAPRSKVEAVRSYGGTPALVSVEELFRYLREHGWEKEPYAFIHPWTDPNVMTGHGSLGLEIMADCSEVGAVYVPVGGGGLIAGVGSAMKAIKPSVRVIAVEPEGCPGLHASFEAGRPVSVECHTICDGVAVPYVTEEMYPLLREVVDEVVLVSESAVKSAIRRLALRNKMIVEGAGALSLAAAVAAPAKGDGPSICILTGGSIDTDKLVSILSDEALDRGDS
ncbi:MAG: pyridoxal-phosphate dependent enzyme [Acidobacteriota bacterium]